MIPLEELPPWAQELIVSTGLGLLEYPDAYAVEDGPEKYQIKANGFTYTVCRIVDHVY